MTDYNKITENEQMFGGGKTMEFTTTLRIILETAMMAFVIWAVFHEDLFVELEDRIIARIRRSRFKVIRGNNVRKSYYPMGDGARGGKHNAS